MKNLIKDHLKNVWNLSVGLSLVVVFQISCAAGPQTTPAGRVLFQGCVRPGLPVALHVGEGSCWKGTWGTTRVEVTGNTAAFLWPLHRPPLLSGPGAPLPTSFQPLSPRTALVGVLPRAIPRFFSRRNHLDLQACVQKAMNRPARFVRLEPALEELPVPVVSCLDLVVAADPGELGKHPSLWAWLHLGGRALLLDQGEDRFRGLGRMVSPGSKGEWETLALPGAFAEIRPPVPASPAHLSPPRRGVPALAVLLYMGAVLLFSGRHGHRPRIFRMMGLGGIFFLGSGIMIFFPSDLWTIRGNRSLWCFPGPGLDAWVHTCCRVDPRGDTRVEIRPPHDKLLLTHLPAAALVKAGSGTTQVSWSGKGWASFLNTRPLGKGFRIRRAGSRSYVTARLPEHVEMRPAYLVRTGEVKALSPLRSGKVQCVEETESVSLEDLPGNLRTLCHGLSLRPSSSILVGSLHGENLDGENDGIAILE